MIPDVISSDSEDHNLSVKERSRGQSNCCESPVDLYTNRLGGVSSRKSQQTFFQAREPTLLYSKILYCSLYQPRVQEVRGDRDSIVIVFPVSILAIPDGKLEEKRVSALIVAGKPEALQ